MKEYIMIKETGNAPITVAELIRCRVCVHSKPWYGDKRICYLWHETGIDVWDEGYCNYARKENGECPWLETDCEE